MRNYRMEKLSRLIAVTIISWCVFAVPLHAENLYSDEHYLSHVSDKKAFRVGDALTIIIIENAEAKSASDKKVDRSYNVTGNVQTDSGIDEAGSLGIGIGRDAGDVTQRAGTLRAAMTVAVIGIDTSGKLIVEGSQRIALDGEEQLITVSGKIRPVDVANDNTVPSSRLVDARIVYSGYDIGDDGKKRNWLYRTLANIGLI